MNNISPKPEQNVTLLQIDAERAKLRRELAASKQRMSELWQDLVTPPSADNKTEQIVNNIQRGFAIYDGVMTGYKLLRRFSAFIPKRKKKR